MRVRCPNCSNPIELVPERLDDHLVCPSCGSGVSFVAETLSHRANLQSVAHFTLLEHVGRGHFGDVWKARDTQLDRIVAIKLPRVRDLDDETVEMFLREARAAAQIRDPHIVTVHEIGREGDTLYIASDFIQGITLAERISTQPLSPEEAARICHQVATSLHQAHQSGVIHRDLKPGNILLDTDGEPCITDFGLAKRDSAEITMTVSGQVLGTPAYMPPEQARGQANQADARSDVYSLGVVLYELLTGKRPFSGGARLLIHQILTDDPPTPRSLQATIPRDLETICLKAMQKSPDARYQTAQELADDLQRFLNHEPIQARPIGLLEKLWRLSARAPRTTALLGATVLLAAFAGYAWFGRPEAGGSGELEFVAVSSEPRKVWLETTPSGAAVAFIPLDSLSGAPEAERIVTAGTSPVNLELTPGHYLVVASLSEDRFHEVYRRVPEVVETGRSPYNHLAWSYRSDGGIDLPEIVIPAAGVEQGMAQIAGNLRFTMGSDANPATPSHVRSVPGFYLDTREVSLDDYVRTKELPPSANPDHPQRSPSHAVVFVSWDQAVSYAEAVGKRLLSESEFELAATSNGTRVYPWGDTSEVIATWDFLPVGEPTYDRLETTPAVFGLYSNVAEWTSSWYTAYPAVAEQVGERADLQLRGRRRIVRGGPLSVINGEPDLAECQIGPTVRIGRDHATWSAGLGFRCGRSLRPRLRPQDFVKVE